MFLLVIGEAMAKYKKTLFHNCCFEGRQNGIAYKFAFNPHKLHQFAHHLLKKTNAQNSTARLQNNNHRAPMGRIGIYSDSERLAIGFQLCLGRNRSMSFLSHSSLEMLVLAISGVHWDASKYLCDVSE